MFIKDCWCTREIEEKLLRKHRVTQTELDEVFAGAPRYTRLGRDRWGDMRYMAVGQADSGRWIAVVFVHEPPYDARVLSARQAASEERRAARR